MLQNKYDNFSQLLVCRGGGDRGREVREGWEGEVMAHLKEYSNYTDSMFSSQSLANVFI